MSQPTDFKFDWVEYSVVAVMLVSSILIGVYYTFFNKQKTFQDYMLGGKSMGVFPVSMSLVASFVSGVTLLGLPTEAYLYGTQYTAANFANATIFVITAVFYLPVYYKLQLNSIFEYLELRFNHTVRVIGTFLYSLSLIVFLPIVIFVPALAFNQVTDVPIHVITPIISASCLFYTAFGGLKAVLWTDALQNMFTMLAMIFVIVLGTQRIGGIQEVWRINREGGRLEMFNMDPDPFSRNTFWTVVIGCVFMYMTNMAANPGSVQRFLAVPSFKHAVLVMVYSSIGFYLIVNLSNFLGLVLFARYHDCDPVAAGLIKNPSQMVPLYVMEISKDYPGLAGLFMSGVLSAALSTMSAWLNTVGGTLYKDVTEVFFPEVRHTEAQQSNIIKAIVFFLGVICVLLVIVVEKLGTLNQMTVSLLGLVGGSILSLFTLGIFFPRANAQGAIAGTLSSLVLSGWVVINAQLYTYQGKLVYPGKVTRIDGCPGDILDKINTSSIYLSNYTGPGTPVIADDSVPLLYRVSYNYYIVLGTLIGVVVGLLVSYLTEPQDLATLNPDLFCPQVRRFLPRRKTTRPNKRDYELSAGEDCKELVELNRTAVVT